MSTLKGLKTGTSVITATFSIGGVTKTATQTLKVEAQPLASIGKPADVTYTGSVFTPTPAVTGTIAVSGHPVNGTDFTYSYSSNTNVGTATVSATGKGNYTGTVSSTFVIKAATISVSAPNQSFVYDGSAQGKAISATTVNNQTATIKYGTTNGSYTLTSAPTYTTAGTYTVYYQVTAPNHSTATGSYPITIGRATPSFELDGQTVAYHNTAYIKARASVVGTIYWGESASSMSSKTSVTTPSSSSFNTTVTSRTSIGTTTIYAYFVPTDTTNYNSVGSSSSYSKSTSAKVNQATDANIVVTVSGNHVYTGSAQVLATKTSGEGVAHFTLGYTTSSSTGVDGVTWGTQDATTILATVPGTYYIWYKFTPDGNHSNTQAGKKIDATCVITNAEISVSVTNPQNYTYNGSAHGTGVSATTQGGQTATIKYGTASGSYTTTTVPTYTNAGTYTVYYQVTAPNHNTSTGSYTVAITNATISVSAPNQSFVYNGSAQGKAISATTKGSQTTTIRYGTTNGSYTLTSAPTYTNAGTYTVYYQVTAPNHNTVKGSYRLEITPRTANLVWGELSWIYNGQPHKTTCVVDNLIGNDTCAVILEGNEITDIGSKTVRAISLTNTDYQLPLTNIEQTLVIKGGLFIKENGVWIPVKDVYKKTSSGWTRVPYEELKVELAKNSGKFVRKTT